MLDSDQSSVANVTRVIQLALTPVFLLTAVAALLNVFSTRLGRVADRVDLLSADAKQRELCARTTRVDVDELKFIAIQRNGPWRQSG
jgi:hypothetical protein